MTTVPGDDTMPGQRRSRQQRRAEIEQAMQASGGDAGRAAAHLGLSKAAFYQQSRRAGVNLHVLGALVRGDVPGVTPAPAVEGPVTLSADQTVQLPWYLYEHLKAQAQTVPALQQELATADRIIATLTRQVGDLARSAGARAALVLLALLVLPVRVAAQPAPNRYDAVARVDVACPGLVQNDHAFTDAVASVLFAEDARWGRNGKRGNAGDPSHDALAFQNPASPFGVSIVDIIVAAGGPNARSAWQDVTQATLNAGTVGVWVRPSGVLPACLAGGSTPVTPTPTPVPPAMTPPPTDLTPILTALARLQADVDEIKNRPPPDPAPPDLGLMHAYIDAMVGNGPGEGMPNHVTDLTQRLEVIRVTLEQLDAWLRRSRVLRY